MSTFRKIIAGLIALAIIVAAVVFLMPAPEAPESGATQQTGAPPAALTVTVAAPVVETWPVEVEASGWLAAWAEAVISSEVGGQRIQAVNADVGDVVAKGDVLAELSRSTIENDIRQLEASVDSAQATLEQASADAERGRRLSGSGSISEQQIAEYLVTERKAQADLDSAKAQLASAQLDLERTHIIAVSDGIISSRSAALGDVVTQGEEMFRLIRDGRVEWQAEVPLRELLSIEVGTDVIIPTPIGDVSGSVRQIAPSASEKNGRVKIFVTLQELENGPQPKTGILVSGRFLTGEREATSIPASAVVMQDGFSYVFTLAREDATKVRRERVETGRRRNDRVELLGDFPADAQVVQSGGAFLSDGATVKVVNADQTADEGDTQ